MPYSNIEKADEADLISLAEDRQAEVNGGTILVSPTVSLIPVSIIVTKA